MLNSIIMNWCCAFKTKSFYISELLPYGVTHVIIDSIIKFWQNISDLYTWITTCSKTYDNKLKNHTTNASYKNEQVYVCFDPENE